MTLQKFSLRLNLALILVIAILAIIQRQTWQELQQYKTGTESSDIDSSSTNPEIVNLSSTCTATVNTRILNQRSGAGESYRLVGDADRGETFSVMGANTNQQWLLVDTDEGSAWMAARYMNLSGSCDALTVSSEIASAAIIETEEAAPPIVATPKPAMQAATSTTGLEAAITPISEIFTEEVQYWATHISAWAVEYEIDPNIIATVIQIESCGNPNISSSAGAQGLFQVMPFHFAAGEEMTDIQTNAKRGLTYLQGALELSNGDVGLALAGYNGGYGVISGSRWANETQNYYYWGNGIYAEALSGDSSSATLQEWLSAGGSNLCTSARQAQEMIG